MCEHWQRKRAIIKKLSTKHFVSGENLAAELGITRSAISKQIETLNQYGVSVFSVKGKGYKLEKPISLIDEQQLKSKIARRCFYFDELASTNAYMLTHASELEAGDLCVAEYQSAGRGRRGRTWVSPYAGHLYFSIFWIFPGGMNQAMGLSLIVGCSLIKALADFGVTNLGLKWPNDLYLDGKKLAGVLVEMTGQADSECRVVIGIGLNISMSAAEGDRIDRPWADLSQVTTRLDKTLLMVSIYRQLIADLQLFDKQGLAAFYDRWQQDDLFINQQVQLQLGDKQVSGTYLGIDDQGAALLKTPTGKQAFFGGEISLRPEN